MVSQEEVKQVCYLGGALWPDPVLLQNRALETVSAVSLLNLSGDLSLEKIGAAFLERADRDGARAIEEVSFHPFFRLYPVERFVLAALHRCRWSYARLARVLKIMPEQVSQLAWQARLKLVPAEFYPVGTGTSLDCPPYSIQDPWTQRLLDGELLASEKNALQQHMQICDSCRNALQRCRYLYYQVDRALPQVATQSETSLREILGSVSVQAHRWVAPSERTFLESLAVFIHREDVRWATLLLGGFTILLIFRIFS